MDLAKVGTLLLALVGAFSLGVVLEHQQDLVEAERAQNRLWLEHPELFASCDPHSMD